MVRLVDVYAPEIHSEAIGFLFEMLQERHPDVNISHKVMPSFEAHLEFINSKPYAAWYIVMNGEGTPLGNVYLTGFNEIGIFITKSAQKRGLGRKAIDELIKRHPKTCYYANISPRNQRSIAIFERMGFRQIQVSFKLDMPSCCN